MISEKKATRSQKKGAREIIRLGLKALAYRRDVLPAEEVEVLEKTSQALKDSLDAKPVLGDELEEKAMEVDEALRKSGGHYYHKKGWVENVEMLLVAAIVVIGIRSFFVQPFIIPTNSMYPSFYGMQPYVYDDDDSVPNLAQRAVDKILLGASHYSFKAERSGSLYLLDVKQVASSFPNGRFFVFPTTLNEYVFEIGGKEHSLQVPVEFDLQELLARKFGGIENLDDIRKIIPPDRNGMLKLSERIYKEGEVVLAFDVLLGDALFVDRFTYNFIKPKSGDPAVFRTGTIDEFNKKLNTRVTTLIGEDKYYIKRLVGEPGDKLEMQVPPDVFTNGTDVVKGVPGILFRNDEPIKGKIAFEQNRLRTESLAIDPRAENKRGFPGYRAEGLLRNRSELQVPTKNSPDNPTKQNAYFAMGDNSTDSLDGRAWGFVPEKEIIGRALFIYYPFTKRWGIPD